MVLAQPEQRVGEQEVADLVAPVVEDQRAPVGVRAAPRVVVLVERGPVEAGEGEVVAREVRGDPVEDHAEPVLVQAVDELAEVVGRAVARGRGEVARDLVAPRAAERVRHHRQQLDVGEAHVLRVGGELVRQLEVGERAAALVRVQPPRAEMDLVDRDRLVELRRLAAPREPLRVAPLVARLVDHRRRLRRQLGGEGDGIGLEPDLARLREDLELVVGAVADAGEEELPDAARAERAHRVQAAVPRVEVADDRDGARARRPDGEGGAVHALVLDDVRAELGVELLVAALAHEVQVHVAERRQEAVRVADGERAVLAVVDLELVVERERGALHLAREDALVARRRELDGLAVREAGADGLRGRPVGADEDAAVAVGMGAEEGVGVRRGARGELGGVGHRPCSNRSAPDRT